MVFDGVFGAKKVGLHGRDVERFDLVGFGLKKYRVGFWSFEWKVQYWGLGKDWEVENRLANTPCLEFVVFYSKCWS